MPTGGYIAPYVWKHLSRTLLSQVRVISASRLILFTNISIPSKALEKTMQLINRPIHIWIFSNYVQTNLRPLFHPSQFVSSDFTLGWFIDISIEIAVYPKNKQVLFIFCNNTVLLIRNSLVWLMDIEQTQLVNSWR